MLRYRISDRIGAGRATRAAGCAESSTGPLPDDCTRVWSLAQKQPGGGRSRGAAHCVVNSHAVGVARLTMRHVRDELAPKGRMPAADAAVPPASHADVRMVLGAMASRFAEWISAAPQGRARRRTGEGPARARAVARLPARLPRLTPAGPRDSLAVTSGGPGRRGVPAGPLVLHSPRPSAGHDQCTRRRGVERAFQGHRRRDPRGRGDRREEAADERVAEPDGRGCAVSTTKAGTPVARARSPPPRRRRYPRHGAAAAPCRRGRPRCRCRPSR